MELRRLAARYLPEPVQVPIQPTQVLEPEPLEAVCIFVRTQIGATDLAAQLQVRGDAPEAL
jgi:hypothetical protein